MLYLSNIANNFMIHSCFDSRIHYLGLIMVDHYILYLDHGINLDTIAPNRLVCQSNNIIFHTHSSYYSSIFHHNSLHHDNKICHFHYVDYSAYILYIYHHSHILIQHSPLLFFHWDLMTIQLIIHLTILGLSGCFLIGVTGVESWVVC